MNNGNIILIIVILLSFIIPSASTKLPINHENEINYYQDYCTNDLIHNTLIYNPYYMLINDTVFTKGVTSNNQGNSDVNFKSPLNNSIYRAGDPISIMGNISRECFKRYNVEWTRGLNNKTWESIGIRLEENGLKPVINGTIATWNTSHIHKSDFYTLRITVHYWKSKLLIFLNPLLKFTRAHGLLYNLFSLLDNTKTFYIKNIYFDTSLREGWPVIIKWDKISYGEGIGHYWWPGRLMPVISDVDNDGMNEIFVIQQADPWSIIHGFEANGSYVNGWPQEIPYDSEPADANPSLTTPTIVDIDGDDFQEIIVTVLDGIKIYNYNGTLRNEFQYHVSGQPRTEVPVVDLNHDGEYELINLHEIREGDGKYISVTDLSGNVLGDWPQLYYNVKRPGGSSTAASVYEAIPAVGNFDDDPDLEIVVVGPRNVFDDPSDLHESWHVEGRVIVYNMDGSVLDGFPVDVDGWILKNAAVGDINQDGYDEIVVGSRFSDNPGYSDEGYGLFVIDRFGGFCPGWPQLTGVGLGIAHNPSLADFEGDGYLEIVAGTVDHYDDISHSIYVFNHRGEVLFGWPQKTAFYSAVSPTIADITGDGVCDIVFPAGSGVFPGYEGLGGVYAFHINGTVIDGFPKITDMEADASVTIVDVDSDGLIELIGSSHWNRDCQTFESKHLCEIYVWELETKYDEECVEWPRFQHDLWYSGFYSLES